MCRFYSFLTDEKGNRYGMNHQARLDIKNGKSDLRADSHASIAKLWSIDEDKCNKYEFNPLTRELKLDMQNLSFNDKELINIDELLEEVKEAVPELIIKPIIDPFKDIKFEGEVTDEMIGLVKEWSKVRNSIDDSVDNSVYNSIDSFMDDSIYDSIWDSVRDFAGDSVLDSLGCSGWDSIRDSVNDSIWNSTIDFVDAYFSSFFNIAYPYDFSPAIKLWEMGLVPSFDGKKWRLHSYKSIVWEEQL